MPVYVLARGRITDRAMHDEYCEKAVPTLPPEARILAFDLTTEVVEGDAAVHRTILIEFPSREAFRAWYDSPAYRKILQLRLDSVPGELVVAEGFVPPQS